MMAMRVRVIPLLLLLAAGAFGQTPTPAPAVDNDKPSWKFGATIFGDYTWQDSPTTLDANGDRIHPGAFNITRAYLNFTGNVNRRIGFRITPDVARESGSGASLAGSQELRLKYAFVQVVLDPWLSKGSWARAGVQQTPFLDYTEGIYGYRFQGTLFPERVGAIGSSDAGVSLRYALPGDHGDIHGGYYNGEGYTRAETNDQKAIQIRATYRPLPAHALWKGLRLTGFVIADHYVEDGERQRAIAQATFEHARFNAGADLLRTTDRLTAAATAVHGAGWSVWTTPKLGTRGWQLLLRHDVFEPNRDAGGESERNIAGIAYWVQHLDKATAAVLVDYDSLVQRDFPTARPDETRYGVKLLLTF